MKVDLIDHMGSDLMVVNAARVSFDKESKYEDPDNCNTLSQADQKLISYLAKHNHWTPFSHPMITMRETVPIFVARQRFKHMVGFTYNEVSRRYVSDEPEFYRPNGWRLAAENKKQGSSDELINDNHTSLEYNNFIDTAIRLYNDMINIDKIAPEQARMVLPQSMYTSYYVTGSLAAWARAYKLRIDPHAQKEIQDIAKMWQEVIGGLQELKYSWMALTENASS